MAVVEAWFLGGPADGRVMLVEQTADGDLPKLVRLSQVGLHFGASEAVAPRVEHIYVLGGSVDDTQVYQYERTVHG
ncbi:hypothetical protein ABZV78_29625 [Micromonospora sp. NPDC004540]|uniref:hypothetical protein n=1 Tax=Micromonospora sp. NPDC004540 TaxID=3154457 RepID=UPI00339FFFAF